MPGPLLAEAYSEARLDLSTLDADIRSARQKLERFAADAAKKLDLVVKLDTSRAERKLAALRADVERFKTQVERDGINLDATVNADLSDARSAGAALADAVRAGFGDVRLVATVDVDSVRAVATGADARRDVEKGFGDPELHVSTETDGKALESLAALRSELSELRSRVQKITIDADVEKADETLGKFLANLKNLSKSLDGIETTAKISGDGDVLAKTRELRETLEDVTTHVETTVDVKGAARAASEAATVAAAVEQIPEHRVVDIEFRNLEQTRKRLAGLNAEVSERLTESLKDAQERLAQFSQATYDADRRASEERNAESLRAAADTELKRSRMALREAQKLAGHVSKLGEKGEKARIAAAMAADREREARIAAFDARRLQRSAKTEAKIAKNQSAAALRSLRIADRDVRIRVAVEGAAKAIADAKAIRTAVDAVSNSKLAKSLKLDKVDLAPFKRWAADLAPVSKVFGRLESMMGRLRQRGTRGGWLTGIIKDLHSTKSAISAFDTAWAFLKRPWRGGGWLAASIKELGLVKRGVDSIDAAWAAMKHPFGKLKAMNELMDDLSIREKVLTPVDMLFEKFREAGPRRSWVTRLIDELDSIGERADEAEDALTGLLKRLLGGEQKTGGLFSGTGREVSRIRTLVDGLGKALDRLRRGRGQSGFAFGSDDVDSLERMTSAVKDRVAMLRRAVSDSKIVSTIRSRVDVQGGVFDGSFAEKARSMVDMLERRIPQALQLVKAKFREAFASRGQEGAFDFSGLLSSLKHRIPAALDSLKTRFVDVFTRARNFARSIDFTSIANGARAAFSKIKDIIPKSRDVVTNLKVKGTARALLDYAKIRLAQSLIKHDIDTTVTVDRRGTLRRGLAGLTRMAGSAVAGIVKGVSALAGGLADGIGKLAEWGSKAGEIFGRVGDWLGNAGAKVGEWAGKLSAVAGPIGSAIAAAAGPAMMAGLAGAVAIGVGPLVAAIGGLIGAAIAFIVPSIAAGIAAGLLPMLAILFDETAKNKLLGFIGPLKTRLIDEFSTMTSFITDTIAPKIVSKLDALIPVAAQQAAAFIVPITNEVLRFLDQVGPMISTLAGPMGAGIASVLATLNQFVPEFTRIAMTIGPPITEAVNALVRLVMMLGGQWAGDIAGAFTVLQDLFNDMSVSLSGMQGILTPIMQVLAGVAKAVFDAGAQIRVSFGSMLKDHFMWFMDQLPEIMGMLVALGGAVAAAMYVVRGLWTVMKLGMGTASGFLEVMLALAGWAVYAMGRFAALFKTIMDGLSWVVRLGSKIPGIGGGFKKAAEWLDIAGAASGMAAEGLDGWAGSIDNARSKVHSFTNVMWFGSKAAKENTKAVEDGRLSARSYGLALQQVNERYAAGEISARDYADALKEQRGAMEALYQSALPATTKALSEFNEAIANGEFNIAKFVNTAKTELPSLGDFTLDSPKVKADKAAKTAEDLVESARERVTRAQKSVEDAQKDLDEVNKNAAGLSDARVAELRSASAARVKAAEDALKGVENAQLSAEENAKAARKRAEDASDKETFSLVDAIKRRGAKILEQLKYNRQIAQMEMDRPYTAQVLAELDFEKMQQAFADLNSMTEAQRDRLEADLKAQALAGVQSINDMLAAAQAAVDAQRKKIERLMQLESAGLSALAQQMQELDAEQFNAVWDKLSAEQGLQGFVDANNQAVALALSQIAAQQELELQLHAQKTKVVWQKEYDEFYKTLTKPFEVPPESVKADPVALKKWEENAQKMRATAAEMAKKAADIHVASRDGVAEIEKAVKGANEKMSGDAGAKLDETKKQLAGAVSSAFTDAGPELSAAVNKVFAEMDLSGVDAAGRRIGELFMASAGIGTAAGATVASYWIGGALMSPAVKAAAANAGVSAGAAFSSALVARIGQRSMLDAMFVPANVTVLLAPGGFAATISGTRHGAAYVEGLKRGLLDGSRAAADALRLLFFQLNSGIGGVAMLNGWVIGAALMSGVQAGINGNLDRVKEAAVAAAAAIVAAVETTLEINSPSRVMMRVGGHVVDGLAQGMIQRSPNVMAAAAGIAAGLPGQIASAAAGSVYNSSTVKNSVENNYWQVTSSDPAGVASEVERKRRDRQFLNRWG